MREIKFRAWDERNKQMVYSNKEDCFYINTKGALFMYAIPKSESGLETLYHRDYKPMQYTGLLDTHGVEIYEGDVVLIYGYGEYECKFPFIELYEALAELDIGAIVGNIYENPELTGDLPT